MNAYQAAIRAAALVTQAALQTVLGVLAGVWLDGRLETTPGCALALGFIGFATGMFVTWRAFQHAASDDDQGEP